MVMIKRESNKSPSRTKVVDLNIPDEWLDQFYSLMANGSRWNQQDNAFLQGEYDAGYTPRQAMDKCSVIRF